MMMTMMIQVLREGKRGYGILVSSVPKETNAFYSLGDPSEVRLIFWISFLGPHVVSLTFYITCSTVLMKRNPFCFAGHAIPRVTCEVEEKRRCKCIQALRFEGSTLLKFNDQRIVYPKAYGFFLQVRLY